MCKEHGIFEQTPHSHQKGIGCHTCAKEKSINTIDVVIEKFKSIHDDRYDYSLVDYKKSSEKVKIICKEHGIFKQTPSNHLKGQGCKKCADDKCSKLYTLSNSESIKNFKHVHGDRYDYSLVDYKSKKTKVKITCKEHGIFEQTPSNHNSGSGCPKCSISGFDKSKPSILYYLKFEKLDLFKVGITNRTIDKRFCVKDRNKFKVLKIFKFVDGEKCYDTEQTILRHFDDYRYRGVPILESGNTEIFTRNILNI